MLDDKPDELVCPGCGNKSVVKGWMGGDGFAPEPLGRWFGVSSFHRVLAFVCLDCGVPTPFLSRADVERVRNKYGRRRSDKASVTGC